MTVEIRSGETLYTVQLLKVTADLADRHAAGIHGDDLLVEVREPALVFSDQLRIEGAGPVTWNIQRHLRRTREDRLLRSAAMAIGFSIRRFRIKMRVELRIQDTFRQPFLQLVKQTVLGEYRFWITPLQQLVQ